METALLGETEALMREGKENRCECLASQHSFKHGLAYFSQTVWILVDSGHEGHEKNTPMKILLVQLYTKLEYIIPLFHYDQLQTRNAE